MYLNGGYQKCILKYGEKSRASVSTLRDRGKKLAAQGCTNPIGWPGKLTDEETTALKTYFDDVRAEGAVSVLLYWRKTWWRKIDPTLLQSVPRILIKPVPAILSGDMI